ncbi:MAG TPA: SGNH/GDSL hydrolase family protein [Terrimesophilobacter sp.]|nr:SGNH/GDSL hydrolase family protein [Terrimesophilobacter sp.]
MQFRSYVAIGDSFTEGVGDEQPDGSVRGWADFVAIGLALAARERDGADAEFTYANLAIRGRLLGPIFDEQLRPAIDMKPDLISFNGGGNDIMRPKVTIEQIADRTREAVDEILGHGIHVLLLSGGNPTRHSPLGDRIRERGDALAVAVRERLPEQGVTFVDNWSDAELENLRYWSVDKLHLGPLGHRRVAGNVLRGLGVAVPDWGEDADELKRPGTLVYWRDFVLPWIGRRLTGRSSGDGRLPKRPTLAPVEPT